MDKLKVEKADAAHVLELKMVEIVMRNPESEVLNSCIDETLNPLSDFFISA